MSDVHDAMGLDLAGFGGYLRCESCGRLRELGDVGYKLRHGWPKGDIFYCPAGHGQSYTKSEVTRLREKLEDEKKNAEFWRKRADEADRSKAAIKGQLTKERKRVGNGVCPCCNRTFQNVARHMASKHPDFKDQPPGD